MAAPYPVRVEAVTDVEELSPLQRQRIVALIHARAALGDDPLMSDVIEAANFIVEGVTPLDVSAILGHTESADGQDSSTS